MFAIVEASLYACVATDPRSTVQVEGRLRPVGNRRINTALHVAAVTQIRLGAEGSAYYAKLIATGKTRTEALRRRISDRVFAAMRTDEPATDVAAASAGLLHG